MQEAFSMLYVLNVYLKSNVICQFIKYLQLLSGRLLKLTKSAESQTRVTCCKWQQWKTLLQAIHTEKYVPNVKAM